MDESFITILSSGREGSWKYVCLVWGFLGILPWALNSIFAQQTAPGRLYGLVIDEGGSPVPAATVTLLPVKQGCITGEEGQFEFGGLVGGTYQVITHQTGFQPDTSSFELGEARQLEVLIRLEYDYRELAEIVIVDEHAKQEDLLATEHLDAQDLARNIRGNFSEALSRLPGLDAINTGVGIAKPVIRGLSFNRVVVNDKGIQQQGQQWGADHGLEVDAFSVSRVEIVKGPASLQYGSDGLGGVINLMPAPIPDRNSISGQVIGIAKSNNRHIGGSAHLDLNRNDLWLSLRYTRQDFGDYRVPADTFVYQGFVLPLFDGYLKNTAGEEENREVEAGIRRKWGVMRLTYSHYRLRSGLFSGAVGVPRSYALQPDGNSRDTDLPYQSVDHYKLLLNQTILTARGHLNLNLGYQHNRRREFGYPEFHNQPEIDPSDVLALGLDLQTISGNVHYEFEPDGPWTHTVGLSAEHQENSRSGWEFLLPDFQTWRSGVFWISKWKPTQSRWSFSGGGRVDFGTNQSDFFQRYVWNSNGRITDSLSVPPTDDLFVNWSGSVGGRFEWRKDALWLKWNLGKSFRVPYPSETVSNGVHHGTFRHEQGTPELRSEHGYQLDLGLDWQAARWQAHLAGYVNFFDNFIYLGPSGRLSTLPEAGQIFRYQQNDAIYAGFELDWQWNLTNNWSFYQAAEYVWNINLVTTLSLPFTPQPSLLSEVQYRLDPQARHWQELYAAFSHRLVLANGPNRVDRNERTTPGYQLFDASIGSTFIWKHGQLDLSLQGQNLFNTAYLNHLSRYRLINVPEQGRNVVLVVKVPVGK